MRPMAILLTVTLGFLAAPTMTGFAEEGKKEEKKDEKLHTLMVRKLECSQKVLEGLALNDFDKITKNADELILVSKQVEWKVVKTPQYEVYSNDFRRIADDLAKNSRAKNIDGVALNYVDLTLTCVKCHKYVREARMTRLDD